MRIKFNTLVVFSTILIACNSNCSTPNAETETKSTKEVSSKAEKHETDTLKGIDVSHFNGHVNWTDVHEQGYDFAYAKATQGEGFIDPEFGNNWSGIKNSNMKRGAYHFYVADEDPVKQAELFVRVVKSGLAKDDLAPVLDLEGTGIGDLSVEEYQKNVLSWLEKVESELGVQPIIYTDNPFGNSYLNSPKFSKYKLWIAEYAKHLSGVPAAWKSKGWLMWQHESRGDLKGIDGNVDEDYMLH